MLREAPVGTVITDRKAQGRDPETLRLSSLQLASDLNYTESAAAKCLGGKIQTHFSKFMSVFLKPFEADTLQETSLLEYFTWFAFKYQVKERKRNSCQTMNWKKITSEHCRAPRNKSTLSKLSSVFLYHSSKPMMGLIFLPSSVGFDKGRRGKYRSDSLFLIHHWHDFKMTMYPTGFDKCAIVTLCDAKYRSKLGAFFYDPCNCAKMKYCQTKSRSWKRQRLLKPAKYHQHVIVSSTSNHCKSHRTQF